MADRAAEVAVTVPPADRSRLIAAAWLHDIEYSPVIRHTGFHPLDGELVPARPRLGRTAGLPGRPPFRARFVQVARRFAALMADFLFEDSPVSDALTYADQTVGPHGRPMSVPYLLAVADRVEQRLAIHLGDPRPGSRLVA